MTSADRGLPFLGQLRGPRGGYGECRRHTVSRRAAPLRPWRRCLRLDHHDTHRNTETQKHGNHLVNAIATRVRCFCVSVFPCHVFHSDLIALTTGVRVVNLIAINDAIAPVMMTPINKLRRLPTGNDCARSRRAGTMAMTAQNVPIARPPMTSAMPSESTMLRMFDGAYPTADSSPNS